MIIIIYIVSEYKKYIPPCEKACCVGWDGVELPKLPKSAKPETVET